ncbi:MAG: redoxin domain-containing protein [Planctomycetota bacterium]|nr:redoxin domain-containing protein [Planctomycetota bacterium]
MQVTTVVCGFLTVMVTSQCSNCLSQQSASTAELSIVAKDVDGKPIPNAIASIFRWTGKMESLEVEAETDQNGRGVFLKFPAGEMLYVGIHADGYASTHSTVELSEGERRDFPVILGKPVSCWIQVNRPDGTPAKGAEFQRLDFVDPNARQVVVTVDTVQSLNTSLTATDQSGRLHLPPVPHGARITAWVAHPDLKLAKLEGIIAGEGEIHSVELQPGVPVKLSLVCDGINPGKIDGDRFKVMLFPRSGGSSSVAAVMRTVEVRGGQLTFTAHPENYSAFYLLHDDYFITPQFENMIWHPNPSLDLRSQPSFEDAVMIRSRVKARGRIVDPSGQPLSKVYVSSSVSNIGPNEQNDRLKHGEWAAADNSETDGDGYFELDVAPGNAAVEAIQEGYFRNPPSHRFTAASNGVTELPPIILAPVPTLRGHVLSESGQPVKGAIARMRSSGRGDVESVVLTDEHGRFTLSLTRIPYRVDGGALQTDAFVIAIDPGTGHTGRAAVDLTNAESLSDIRVSVQKREPNWILRPLADQPDSAEPEELLAARRELYAERVKQFSAGLPGEIPPDLSEGTWLHSPARSLKDLRSKFVMLDFWFIGCGPCHRDLPAVKATYDAFKAQGFTVVSIHDKSQSPEVVDRFVREHDMTFPVVVDNSDGTLLDQYSRLGISSFPSYILLDPDGRILLNDATADPSSIRLRSYKTEAVFHALQTKN